MEDVAAAIPAICMTAAAGFALRALVRKRQGSQDEPVATPISEVPRYVLIGHHYDKRQGLTYPVMVPLEYLQQPALFSGKTQHGKSREAGILLLQKIAHGEPVIVIDPHGSLFTFLQNIMLAKGMLNGEMRKKTLFIDLPAAADQGLHVAFDILKQGLSDYDAAEAVLDAFHRVWKLDASSALDRLLPYACLVLSHHKLPITMLDEFIEDNIVRTMLLKDFPDQTVVSYFRYFDTVLPPQQKASETIATQRRTMRLTFSPRLRYPLANDAPVNLANWSSLLASGTSVIINLNFPSLPTTKLWGALLTVALEQAVKQRPLNEGEWFTAFIDEFTLFTEQEGSAETLNHFVQETLKRRFSLWLCHQGLSTVPESTQGALDTNIGFRTAFTLGETDAEHMAPYFYRVNTRKIKARQFSPSGPPRPVYFSPEEQRTDHRQELMELGFREAMVRLPDGQTGKITTPDMPDPDMSGLQEELEELKQYYLSTLFRSEADIEKDLEARRAVLGVSTEQLAPLRAAAAAKGGQTSQHGSTTEVRPTKQQQPQTLAPQKAGATIGSNATPATTPDPPQPKLNLWKENEDDLIV